MYRANYVSHKQTRGLYRVATWQVWDRQESKTELCIFKFGEVEC